MSGHRQYRNGLWLFCVLFIAASCFAADGINDKGFLEWDELSVLPAASGQDESLGVAGPFAGISNDALIVAGGANFPKPYWGKDKVWHKDIWILEKNEQDYKWYTGFELDRPIAYGMSVTTQHGLICIGGADGQQCYSDVFLLSWDRDNKKIIKEVLPSLPENCVYGSATVIKEIIYVAGGQNSMGLDSAMKNFWSLDLSKKTGDSGFVWEELPSWPGPERAFNITAAQFNGKTDCVYVISGRAEQGGGIEFLKDVYEFTPDDNSWEKRASLENSVCAASASAVGQSHIFIFGADNGTLFFNADELGGDHPGFAKDILAYHTITDTWVKSGKMPQTHVTSAAVTWNDEYLVVSGEVRPRVRSPKILQGRLVTTENYFGSINFATLVIYLLAMVGVGIYFSTRNKNTDDFSSTSFMTTAIWVMIIGGIGQNLVPYVSDQAVVQRYLSVSDVKAARKSILTNALIIIPATLLFFGVGTAMFVFYKLNPGKLDPNYQTDAIFPLFIARQLPVGISGLVVAGIFAAAQSTVSTSMNSISTVVVTDFVKRFSLLKTEKAYLNLARFSTLFFGTLGTLLALLFASADIKSLWESFMSVLGFFGGSMCGLFLLGMFTCRVGSTSAITGAVIGAVVLFLIKLNTDTSVLLYATIGIVACVLGGYLLSFILPEKQKDLAGLTIFT